MEKIIIALEIMQVLILVDNDSSLLIKKFSKCFLYKFVLKNHLWNLSDPLEKQNNTTR